MLPRIALAVLLLVPSVATAQDSDSVFRAVVRITGVRPHKRVLGSDLLGVHGSGFVVGLDRDRAMIVTTAHVIEKVQRLEVNFAADPTTTYRTVDILGAEYANPRGLAFLYVRGKIPLAVAPLCLEAEAQDQVRSGEDLFVVGFPSVNPSPITLGAKAAGQDGNYLELDRSTAEGFFGSPVLRNLRKGMALAVVVAEDPPLTLAVKAVVARDAAVGYGGKLGGPSDVSVPSCIPPTKPEPPAGAACTPGEELIENGIAYVRICPGTFTMGSAANDPLAGPGEMPAHQVTLGEFWLGKTEITAEQYRQFYPGHRGGSTLAATGVSWNEARDVCEHLGGRLPTEAEWEYAARAGSATAWSFGNDEMGLGDYGWYDANSGGKVHPIGTRKANAWGLYDMHGNVWEWVADWYGSYPSTSQTDPTGPATGTHRIVRGGAFDVGRWNLRSAARSWVKPSFAGENFGFRCARGPRRQR